MEGLKDGLSIVAMLIAFAVILWVVGLVRDSFGYEIGNQEPPADWRPQAEQESEPYDLYRH